MYNHGNHSDGSYTREIVTKLVSQKKLTSFVEDRVLVFLSSRYSLLLSSKGAANYSRQLLVDLDLSIVRN